MGTKGTPIRCKGAIAWEAGEALVIEEVEVAPPKQNEVRIKIICTSLCHSDLTFWKLPGVFPRIFGHESVGIVESVGEGTVSEFKEGDMVVPFFLGNCTNCEDCMSSKSNMCTGMPFSLSVGMPRDEQDPTRFTTISTSTSIDHDHGQTQRQRIYHFLNVSSFVEYTVVDVAHLVKINADIPPQIACLLGCGVSTGVGSSWRAVQVEKGSKVAVFGLGCIGLAVAEGARLRGATQIIGVDLNPEKFEIGKKFGITDFINPKDYGDKPVSKVIQEMTSGGVDYSFECVGLASLMLEAYQSTRLGWGKTIILGVESSGAPLSLPSQELLCGRTLMGSLFGGIKGKTDIPILAAKYENKELRLEQFITHEVGFNDIQKAFDLMLQGKGLRCIIWMDA